MENGYYVVLMLCCEQYLGLRDLHLLIRNIKSAGILLCTRRKCEGKETFGILTTYQVFTVFLEIINEHTQLCKSATQRQVMRQKVTAK